MLEVSIIGAVGERMDKERFVEYFRQSGGDGVALDADAVYGMDHLKSALMHAERSLRRGDNVSKRLLMETLLYASGERQLSVAISKIGLRDGPGSAVLLIQGLDPDRVIEDLELRRDDTVISSNDGETKEALERVALVDIIKR